MARLQAYEWPGNVRQLCTVITCLADAAMTTGDLPTEGVRGTWRRSPVASAVGMASPVAAIMGTWNGAGGGVRTHTALSGARSLSPVRLPVSPPRRRRAKIPSYQ